MNENSTETDDDEEIWRNFSPKFHSEISNSFENDRSLSETFFYNEKSSTLMYESDNVSDSDSDNEALDTSLWPEWAKTPENEKFPLDCTEVINELRKKPKLVYHLAKDRRGRVYARVLKTMLVPTKTSKKVLCSNRVSQMTKTYNDIEAVTRLLHEKEKDIELTARIGKDLLAYNSRIESDNTELRNELKIRNEQISQLQHELHCKTELIRALTSDVDSSEATTPCDESLKKLPGSNSITVQDLDLLQRKVKGLEDENKILKGEHEKLVLLEDECQSKEQSLVSDITNRLIMAESDCIAIHDELERQREENKQQHEEILALRGALNEAQLRLARLTEDHENQSRILEVTKETQGELAGELLDYKQRYEEVVALLREAQEQARIKRKKAQPSVRPGLLPWSNLAGTGESLQSELEGSIHSDSSYDSGISPASDRLGAYSSFGSTPMGPSTNPQYKRVFDTVRCASRASSGIGSSLSGSNLTTSSRPYSCVSSIYMDSTGHNTDDSSGEWENYPAKEKPGMPGVPGAADLEAALKRLTPAEIFDRRAQLQMHPWQNSTNFYDSQAGFRTPDSIMSIGSSSIYSSNYSGNSSNSWKLPGSDKLQIVKPLEGSQTLQQWAHLATPTLGGLLDERPGVKIRGGKELQDIGLESYALEDLEEDEEPLREPCKQFISTSTIYTYTTSKIMHVEDGPGSLLSRPGSLLSSRAPSPPPQDIGSDILMSKPGTPCRSRRNSTSTFSTNSGLAQMLNERGIQAVTPSCVGTPLLGYTPTATPCNSPERPSSPTKDALGSPLRRGTNLTKSERKLLAGIKIREKIERIGLDNILPETGKTGFELQAGLPTAGLYAKRCSPMAQLTSLKASCSHQNSKSGPSNPTLPSSDPTILTSKPPISKSKKVFKRSDSSSSTQDIGVPQKPGSGALNRRLEQLSRKGVSSSRRGSRVGAQHRSDLGQVGPQNGTNTKNNEEKTSALGTISFLIFGRKGGLL